jgi:hypothetical protein
MVAKKVRVRLGGAGQPLTVRAEQFELSNVASEGPCPVMILAVDIIGNSAPDRNGGGPWDDRKKPTGGYRQLKDVCEQDAGLASNKARVAIEANEAIQRPRQQQRAARI